ncbi:hypothetical protein KC19_12G065800 [Ceratodon purpureus]|uniref:Protein kinase domain-containing protein n=1 Tax=Ceratodon purpureus TaxID=3225 RepID=A0A8T0G6M7_CERPU|nr:hypothetical protein KC19_12G065800 [Ceratodon purpureus]
MAKSKLCVARAQERKATGRVTFSHNELKALSKVCLEAYHSEEVNFLIDVNAKNQWLRTVIGHEDLHPTTWTEANDELLSKIVIQSNLVPYDPFWSKPLAKKDGTNFKRVHFPSSVLKDALDEFKPLATKLQEWICSGKTCEIGMHSREQLVTSKWFWEMKEDEVDPIKELSTAGIWLITWHGGRFIQKETPDNSEVEIVRRFSHPHIVYCFGLLYRETRRPAYFMEYMENELHAFMGDRKRADNEKPPFLLHESVSILLQIARAMEYMHEVVNVVHCDLKSANVLITEITISDTVKHYLVKVADFGSARSGNSGSGSMTGFVAGNGTTPYTAPEALQQQQQFKDIELKDKTAYISYPHKIDVYSFGIISFEVLTGDTYEYFQLYRSSPTKFKAGVIGGTIRPSLCREWQNVKFLQDKGLKLLIESCWHPDPSKRPTFVKICKDLDCALERLSGVSSKNSLLDRVFRKLPALTSHLSCQSQSSTRN